MSESEKNSVEQQGLFEPLKEFKLRIANVNKMEAIEILEKPSPEDPELYKKLKKIPEKLPQLPQWFWKMCGDKFQAENIKEVRNSLMI